MLFYSHPAKFIFIITIFIPGLIINQYDLLSTFIIKCGGFMQHKKIFIRFFLLALLTILLLILNNCSSSGDSGCSCMTPLDEPFPEEKKVYDSIQGKLTEHGIVFVEEKLPDIIAGLLPEGLSFEIPPTQTEINFIGTIVVDICKNGCTLNAHIDVQDIRMVEPDKMYIDTLLSLTGRIDIETDSSLIDECPVDIDILNKPLNLLIQFSIDPLTNWFTFSLPESPSIQVSEDEVAFDCFLDWDLIKGFIVDELNSQLDEQFSTILNDQLAGASCLACDAYPGGGCPQGSSCGGDYCINNNTNKCVATPLGAMGKIEASALLGSTFPGANGSIDVNLVLGQKELNPANDPIIENGGLNILGIGGANSEYKACVPHFDPPANMNPPRMPFWNTVEIDGIETSYMFGFALADLFFDHSIWAVYNGGLLCLEIGSELLGGMLSSTTLSLMVPSINEITGGDDAPILLTLSPRKVPIMDIGRGIISENTEDPEGPAIIEEPLLYLNLIDTGLNFYVFADDHYVRLFTVFIDMKLEIALEVTANNEIIPILGDMTNAASNIKIENHNILSESQADMEALMPVLLQMALPQLAGGFSPIALPEVEGMKINLKAIRGDIEKQPVTNPRTYEFLAMYGDLEYVGVQPQPTPVNVQKAETSFSIIRKTVPTIESKIDLNNVKEFIPSITIKVENVESSNLEYQYRIDKSSWSLFNQKPIITIKNTQLFVQGDHSIEVRARFIGDNKSLDDTPFENIIFIDAIPPKVLLETYKDEGVVEITATDIMSQTEDILYSYKINNGEFSKFVTDNYIPINEQTDNVTVRVKDKAGNITEKQLNFSYLSIPSLPGYSSSCGCSVADNKEHSNNPNMFFLLFLAAALYYSLRRKD